MEKRSQSISVATDSRFPYGSRMAREVMKPECLLWDYREKIIKILTTAIDDASYGMGRSTTPKGFKAYADVRDQAMKDLKRLSDSLPPIKKEAIS